MESPFAMCSIFTTFHGIGGSHSPTPFPASSDPGGCTCENIPSQRAHGAQINLCLIRLLQPTLIAPFRKRKLLSSSAVSCKLR
jgi:hypothetical protein